MPKRDKGRDLELLGKLIAEKYRVLEVLGQGGFGTVFLVEITAGMVGERLALKILPEELGAQPAFREQFLNEIRVAMRLVDRHIVQIRDVGATQDGILYYTMDLCPGMSLAQILRKEGKLPITRALVIVLNVLRGLMAAHGAGIVHRDLKPGNIMVDSQTGKDVVRVLDFGIAMAVRLGERQKGAAGSPHYMPPEQFIGETVGFYSDLYSVGVMLYECITGQRPHSGSTPQEVLRSLKTQVPAPPEQLAPDVASFPGLSGLIQKAIERNPERRYQSARELFEALNDILQRATSLGAPGPTPPAPSASPARPTVERRPAAAAPQPVRISAEHVRRHRRARRSPGSHAAAVAIGAILIAAVVSGVMFHEQIADWLASSPVGKARQAAPAPGPAAAAAPPGPATKAPAKQEPPKEAEPLPAAAGTLEERKAAARASLALRTEKLLDEAGAAAEKGDWSLAAERWETVVSLDAANTTAAQLLGVALLRKGEAQKALEALQGAKKALEAAGATSTPALETRIAEAMLGIRPPLAKDAEAILDRLRRTAPTDAELLVLQARALEAQAKTPQLQKTLATAKQLKIESPDLQAIEARLLAATKQDRAAQAASVGAEASSALEAGEWQRAAELARRAFELEASPRAAATWALAHAAEGRLAEARRAIAAAQGLAGDDAGGRRLADVRKLVAGLEASDALAARAAQEEVAAASDLLAPAAASSDDLVRVIAEIHSARLARRWPQEGAIEARRKAGADARTRLQAALKQSSFPEPLRPEALHMLGLLQLDQGDLEKSEAAYRQALASFSAAEKAGSKTAELYESWARTYDRLGNLIRAASLYRAAYELRPTAAGCLRAANYYLDANPSSPEAIEILRDGMGRFKDSEELRKKYEELGSP